jgi:hypothetical protein
MKGAGAGISVAAGCNSSVGSTPAPATTTVTIKTALLQNRLPATRLPPARRITSTKQAIV